MGDLQDRRARKKAQTRVQIQRIAQHLFAERGFDAVTIADVARDADVAVQTVFNHFATKEELFFADRAGWVDGAAHAVRSRPRGVAPLTALREHFMGTVRRYLQTLADPEMLAVIATLEASPALSAYERELHHESVQLLAEALIEACPEEGSVPGAPPSIALRTWASMTASVWLAAIRGLIIEQRAALGDPTGVAVVESLTDQVLTQLEATSITLRCGPAVDSRPQFSGWPPVARRAAV